MKSKIFFSIVALATAFAFGRWSAPQKIKEVSSVVQTGDKDSKTKTNTDRDRHKKTVITEITKPDGTKVVTTTITDDVETNRKTENDTQDKTTSAETKEKEVTKTASRLNISALAGTKVTFDGSANPLVYGASISKEILGPISIGVWGLSSGVAGASIGLSF